MTPTQIGNGHRPPSRGLWIFVQGMGLLCLVLLITGLFVKPEPTLNILWNLVVPILPLTFLISPAIWRAVCPLATLNMVSGNFGRHTFPARMMPMAHLVGIFLLAVLVPARKFVFNENGPALAIVILAVGWLALILGLLFKSKSGFCNSICPVLPVERLYGQEPLIDIPNPRCTPCNLCTPKHCIDRKSRGSYFQRVKGGSRSDSWLMTVHGVFATAFPGFVYGYFSRPNGPLSEFAAIYLEIFSWALGSFLLFNLIIRLFHLSAKTALILLAALAAGVYYWFALPPLAGALGLTTMAAWIFRFAMLGFILWWVFRSAATGARRMG